MTTCRYGITLILSRPRRLTQQALHDVHRINAAFDDRVAISACIGTIRRFA
jgi:hypothetical protein